MSFKAGLGIRLCRTGSEHDRSHSPTLSWPHFTPGLPRAWYSLAIWAIELILILAAVRSSSAPLRFREVQGHRVADLNVPAEGHAGFTLMPQEVTGIWFSNTVP